MELKDKVILITGSSSGIGRETAIAFVKQGANVIVTYNKNKKAGEETLKECKKYSDCILLELDVSDIDSVKNCVEKAVDKFGVIDILVNNAGIVSWKNFIEQNIEEIEKQIQVNLIGLINMTKTVLPYMQGQDEGIIINISSGAGKMGFGGLTIYCATKFAVRGFTQALSQELPSGIDVYSVNPGTTATKMTNFKGVSPKKVAEVIVKTASGEIKSDGKRDIDVWDYY